MNSKTKFEIAYKNLNPEQKKAVDSIEGPVMVIAGPGTGKTQILTIRIANILDKTDTPPEAILALTFTESAATAMKKRLADIVGSPAYRVNITTFHGFANSIIKNQPDSFPEIIGSTNINEIDQIRTIKQIINDNDLKDLKPFGDKYYYLKSILSAINELKRQGISPKKFGDIARQEEKLFEKTEDLYYDFGPNKGKMKGKYLDDFKHIKRNKELAEIYSEYQKSLSKAKQYDYSDMIMHVMAALEKDKELLLTLQESYLYILVDEHQDTNNAQNKILELLANYFDNPNLFVVGDEKQAIFRFQGASLENFLYFKELYKNVLLIPLKNNYRSTQTILDVAHDILPHEIKLAAQANHKESPVNICQLSSPEAEYFFIAQKIKELIKFGAKPEEIAALYRENRDAAPLARILEKQGIKFNIESDQDVLSDIDIKKLLTILKAIQNFGHTPELYELLHIDFLQIPPLDIYKLAAFSSKLRLKPYDIIKSEKLLTESGAEFPDKFTELYKNISKWKTESKNLDAAKAFENIVRDSGFLSHILNLPSSHEKISKLHALFEQLKSLVENHKNYELKDFFDYLSLIEEHDIMIKRPETSAVSGKVRLMTAHKSKGLEFEHVFIINAIDGKWGSKRKAEHIKLPLSVYNILQPIENKFTKDTDEKNLFYVALTRAKKEIFITYCQKNRDGREQLPTRFLDEINKNLTSSPDLKDFEKELSDNKEMEFSATPEKEPEIKSKEFINELFKSQGLSVTALNNYLECPWKYFYVNLIRIPEAPNKHMAYGNAVHDALKKFFDKFPKEDVDKNYLLDRFEEALARQPIQESDFLESLEKGKKSLSGYHDFYHKEWIKNILNEFKVEAIELDPETKILGKIDKMEFVGANNEVNVVDYKTGKQKSRNAIEGNTKSSDGNYKRQLVFYNLLLNKLGKHSMISGEIDFIEPDEKGRYKKEKFEISKNEISNLENQIVQVSDEIRNIKFWDKFCDDIDCRYCSLRKTLK